MLQRFINGGIMPEKKTLERAKRAKQMGKAPSTQAGKFIREEFDHIREGKHGARSPKQAIAIGLSKARRAGVDLKPPKKGRVSEKSRKSALSAYEKGQRHEPVSKTRSVTSSKALKKEPYNTASKSAISQQVRSAAKSRKPSERSQAAKKAAITKKLTKRIASPKKVALSKKPAKRFATTKNAAITKRPVKRTAVTKKAVQKHASRSKKKA